MKPLCFIKVRHMPNFYLDLDCDRQMILNASL